MPIKAENLALYPADWKQIRARILTRAGHCCEWPGCTARNYAFGLWHMTPAGWAWAEIHDGQPPARSFKEATKRAAEVYFARGEEGPKPIVIVLTIAHLDHRPENCADDNLRAWCQRHHLAHDHLHHQANAQATRRAKAGTLELF